MRKLKSTPNDPRIPRSKGSHSSEPLDSIPLDRWIVGSEDRQALLSNGDAYRMEREAAWSRGGTSIAVRMEFFRGSVVLIENGNFCCAACWHDGCGRGSHVKT
jgi:hypothetical protein